MTTKIRIKMGDVEVEYEGSEDFLRDELKELLSGVVELHREKGVRVVPPSDSGTGTDASGTPGGGEFTGTTNTVAAKLSVKSGTDLIIAAITQRTLVGGSDKTTRTELLKEMQTASSYYKQTYSNNLSKYLKNLVSSDKLREVSKGTFSLSADELKRVRGILAS